MGWLFGKKKVPRAAFPEPHAADPNALRFPNRPSSDKVIEPEKVQEAVGLKKEQVATPSELPEIAPPEQKVEPPKGLPRPMPQPEMVMEVSEPLYIKIELYRRLLGEIEDLHSSLNKLNGVNRDLEQSEYNEENNFAKLRRAIKSMHDRLLQVDKILFKT